MKIIAIILILSLPLLIFVPAAAQDDWRFVDESGTRLPDTTTMADDMAAGDVNADGAIDVLAGCSPILFPQGPGYEQLFYNNGEGFFSLADSGRFPQLDDMTGCVLLFDSDGDLDQDAFVVNFNYQTDYLAENDGHGLFSIDQAGIPPDSQVGIIANYGDIEGDGDIDICMLGNAYLGEDQHRVWINDGSGSFVDEHWRLPPLNSIYSSVEFADVDGDLDLDLLANSRGDYYLPQLLINDGSGVFADETAGRLPLVVWSARAEFVNIDGDADFDIVLGGPSFQGSRLGVWVNDGSGHFADETPQRGPEYPWPYYSPSDIRAADLDGDGDQDLVLGVPSGNWLQAYIFVNLGGGFFEDQTYLRLPVHGASTRALIPADYDNDGDVDIFTVGSGAARNGIYINTLNTPDSIAPDIKNGTIFPEYDTVAGPYPVKLVAQDGVSMEYELRVSVHYAVDEMDYLENPMRYTGGYIFSGSIPQVDSGQRVYYYYTASDNYGNTSSMPEEAPDSVFSFTCLSGRTGIKDGDSELPQHLNISAYPNPFNSSTIIGYSNLEGGDIRIFDIKGQLVKTFFTGGENEGRIEWHATEASGKKVSSGIYFARVSTPQSQKTIKLLLLK